MRGIVKWYDERRAYGYITPLVGKPGEVEDVFVHRAALRGCTGLPIGAEVSFIVVRGNKGPQAADVRLIAAKLVRRRDPGKGIEEACIQAQ